MIDEHDVREMLHRRANKVPPSALDAPKATRRARRRLVANGAVAVLAAAAIGVATFAGLDALRSSPIPATPPETPLPTPPGTPLPTPAVWSPLREGVATTVERVNTSLDPIDASRDWVDMTRVHFDLRLNDGAWWIELAAKPPPPSDREPGLLIAYGLVLDTTEDGVADYVIGIDNDAPERRDFHVWLTDLATGETVEQVGPGYGLPIEFRHPDEGGGGATMAFTFLDGSAPEDYSPETVRFYAWASASRDGEIIASDYAPDAGWMARP